MAITIDSAFIEEYDGLVRHLAQQGATLIRPHVMEMSSMGEGYNFERLGATEAVEKTTRRAATAYVDDIWTRRRAVPKTFNHTMTIEQEDKVQMLVDPQSSYAESQAKAMARAIDNEIIAAVTRDADDGAGGTVALPAGQIVGDGTGEISFDVVTEVQEKFMANTINPDEPKCFVVGPKQVRKLLQLTQVTSSDFVQQQALQQLSSTGIVPSWMGFTWVVSTLLNAPALDQLDCFAMTKKALGLAINADTFTRIGEDPAHSYMIQVFSQWTMGAVRVEDEQIVRIHLADTVTV